MPRHIALLTDFGLADPYVGQMKGALLRHAPDAILVDLSHQVLPFNILQAGFFLNSSQTYFPVGTIFLAVVDPGVGSSRRILLAEVDGRFFFAPDNGLLTQLLHGAPDAVVREVTPGAPAAASATFHGRDVFALLAARLANGEGPETLGQRLDPQGVVRMAGASPVREGNALRTTVLHVDRFGNCLLNLEISFWTGRLAACREVCLTLPTDSESGTSSGHLPLRVVSTYWELASEEVGLLAGSQGYLELALNQTSVASALGLQPGSTITLTFTE